MSKDRILRPFTKQIIDKNSMPVKSSRLRTSSPSRTKLVVTALGETPLPRARSRQQQDFFRRVYEIVQQIPFGKVTTYGHIAAALGAKSSARLVGYALNGVGVELRDHHIPCHRVINRNGELTGKIHFATPTMMRELLEAEDVEFIGEAVNLEKHLWIPPVQD
jgi:methylated-DNA-protein-cysteine methyltransferase-like protein